MLEVLRYLLPYRCKMLLGLILKVVGTLMDLVIPWILAYIIDTVIPQKNIQSILLWGVLMVICSFFGIFGNIAANRMAARVARDSMYALRTDLFAKISSLSCSQVDRFTIPSLISRVTSDSYNIHQMFGMMQRMGVRAPILLFGGIAVTLALDVRLSMVLIATLPIIALVVIVISRRGILLFRKLQQGIDQLVRIVRENISGIRVIKALSKTTYEQQRFDAMNDEVVSRETRAGLTMAGMNPSMNLLLNIGMTAVILTGAFLVAQGLSEAGKIIAFMSYFTIILNSMLAVNRLFSMYTKASASAARIVEVLHTEEDFTPLELEEKKDDAHVRFSHVSFSYHGRKNQIYGLNFALKRGETLGIIGATGSGKSTVSNLLLRLYDVTDGAITIDGKDIRSMGSEELHSKFGIVFQNDMIFADSIMENVSFGRNLSREQVQEALNDAQAEFVSSLPDGIDYKLAVRGANLSGGQKQRVLLARAIAGSPEILILDDASSALDYETDARLRAALAKRLGKATTIVIAQRVSSILHADHILVLDAGHTVGFGTHEELLSSCPLYRETYESQMGGMRDA